MAAWQGPPKGRLWGNQEFGVISEWNGDKRNIEFTMVHDGVVNEAWKDGEELIKTQGFILWDYVTEKDFAGGGETRLVKMKFIKKN